LYGTSASAPAAAAIGALLKSYRPGLKLEHARAAFAASALDIETPGIDRDSGYGVIMANTVLDAVSVWIRGQKFNDLNGNGIKNSTDPGLEGWTIFLDSDNDGALDPNENRTVTDATGAYSFYLPPGTYRVREVQKIGWTRTTTNPVAATLGRGANKVVNFGNFKRMSIAGLKFNDLDGD
jgi:hypothetical protein